MSASVRIACRVRPFINSEARDDSVEVLDDTSVSIINPQDVGKRFRFNFTSVHGQDATQEQLFDRDVLPLLGHVFSGLTVTIFAYGVTSSGKTHTMQGSLEQPGIIPRVVDALFQRKATMSQEDVSLELSYMEIYKDDVFDLMVSAREAKLPVREDGRGKVFVANLTETCIETTDEFDTHFIAACKGRSVAATNFNRASSRSHAILGIKVTVKGKYPGAPTLIGKVNLVDLAGSENNKMTGNDSIRMAESAAINKSLSVLGQVVHALNQRATRIPYRDSKLTRILQDALGGSSISLLICNIAPGARFKQDTLNTLNFASRTKEIENRPVVNQKAPPAPPPAAVTQSGIGIGRPPRRASITPSSSHSALPVSASASGIPVQSRRMSFGARHVSAGPSVTGSGAVGTSRIQPPAHGRRASSVGHSRRTSISGVGGENVVIGLTEKEVEAKIASAVQAALAKREQELKEHAMQEVQRMEEERRRREREEQEEQDRRRREKEQEEMRRQEEEWQRRRTMEVTEELASGPPSYSSVATASHPRNLLDRTIADEDVSTALAQRHLKLLRRVETLEQSRDGPTDMEVAVTMDHVTRKKVAKSLIKRARMYQTQNDLSTALQYYLKAQPYAADNVKLQHRIDKLREAVETGEPFLPSPTPEGGRYNNDSLACRTVATPARKRSRVSALAEVTNEGDDCEDVEMDVDELGMKRRRSFVDY
ncbi:hypothetical protein FRC10_008233 [Ceratobasidium sp. 414]|nr:hypothetical protein FRC10_008233 [Ceratobasidium sp. 414]